MKFERPHISPTAACAQPNTAADSTGYDACERKHHRSCSRLQNKVMAADKEKKGAVVLARAGEWYRFCEYLYFNHMLWDVDEDHRYGITFMTHELVISALSILCRGTRSTTCCVAPWIGGFDEHRRNIMRDLYRLKKEAGKSYESVWPQLCAPALRDSVKLFKRGIRNLLIMKEIKSDDAKVTRDQIKLWLSEFHQRRYSCTNNVAKCFWGNDAPNVPRIDTAMQAFFNGSNSAFFIALAKSIIDDRKMHKPFESLPPEDLHARTTIPRATGRARLPAVGAKVPLLLLLLSSRFCFSNRICPITSEAYTVKLAQPVARLPVI
ncbi:unnamed protein product [Trichogramma brassicae]|uniref:Uncharacterized protein n=1 Tax=Trichogramma brassicae TaxID=86971 RepID=A0A6H5IF54_9HYME|nr:unnamed protein product [Trichogramma brassicae]